MTGQNNSLYVLSNEVEKVIAEVISAEGDLSADLEKRLDAISTDFKEKSGNIGRWVLNIDGNIEAIDRELVRLEHRKKAQNNLKTRLKEYLKFCMINAGLNKVDLQTFNISLAKSPASVEIEDESVIPSKYIRIIQTNSIDKDAIKKDLKAGEKVTGAHLLTDKIHLRIK